MHIKGKPRRQSGAWLTSVAVLAAAVVVVALAGAVVMESPVMRFGILPEEVQGTTRNFWNFAEEADLQALREILEEKSRELSPQTAGRLAEVILRESQRYDLDPALILAVIQTESSYRNWVRSDRNAMGLMQILPETGEDLARRMDIKWEGEASLYLPVINIKLGTYYLSQLRERFDSMELALAAYNRGPNAVRRLIGQGRSPSKRYSRRVLSAYQELKPFFSPRTS